MKWLKNLMSFFKKTKQASICTEAAMTETGAGTVKSLNNATKTVEKTAKAEKALAQEVRTQEYYDTLNLNGTWYNPRSGNTLTSNGDNLYVFSGNAVEHGLPTRQLGGEIQLQTHVKFLENGNLRVTQRTPGKNIANGLGESNSKTWLYDFNRRMKQEVPRMSSQTSTSCGYAI